MTLLVFFPIFMVLSAGLTVIAADFLSPNEGASGRADAKQAAQQV